MPPELAHPNFILDCVCFYIGLCVGSFLNVLALRSLAEESVIYPPSHCTRCNHRLAWYDNIPLLSYAMLRGRCRYCQSKIHWQYPLVELFTAITFVALERVYLDLPNSPFNSYYWNNLLSMFDQRFLMDGVPVKISMNLELYNWGAWPAIIGIVVFACTLIAITITDFREKLIPHEITYPSILFGLAFSTMVRNDLAGALAGVGASYLLFDFIAFYGLKVYVWMHGGSFDEPYGRPRRLRRRLAPRARRRLGRGLRWRVDLASIESNREQEEPLEVMGGGDAVLSAVMAAYLGWQLLVIALLIGFLAGMLMGMCLLVREMMNAKLLHKCLIKSLIFGAAGATIFGALGLLMQAALGAGETSLVYSLGLLGLFGGAMIGVVTVGTKVSKPYPFGPALAIGGFIAMFLLPNWLAISPPLH